MFEKLKQSKKQKIKILYVIVNEDLTSPLLTRQVIELLRDEVSISEGVLDVKIMLFQSVTSLIKRYSTLLSLKKVLRQYGIKLSIVPNLAPWPLPNLGFAKTDNGYRPNGKWNRFAARFFSLYAFPFFALQYFFCCRKIFHSRSYPPAFAVYGAQHVFKKLKHVFDPRSDFPEENVTAGIWGANSKDFKFWKAAEAKLLKFSDKTACISNVYVEHFENNGGSFEYVIAPNNVDSSQFVFDAEVRRSLRLELGLSEADTVFVYLGGMSSRGWHQPKFYRQFFELVLRDDPDVKILFLVPSNSTDLIEREFAGFPGVFVRNPPFKDVTKWLSIGDYGLMFLHKQKIAVGTKIGEYLSVGLPVICNSNCLGTVRFISENPGSGFVFDLGLGGLDSDPTDTGFDHIRKLCRNRGELRHLAERKFSNGQIAKVYYSVYLDLAGSMNERLN